MFLNKLTNINNNIHYKYKDLSLKIFVIYQLKLTIDILLTLVGILQTVEKVFSTVCFCVFTSFYVSTLIKRGKGEIFYDECFKKSS